MKKKSNKIINVSDPVLLKKLKKDFKANKKEFKKK